MRVDLKVDNAHLLNRVRNAPKRLAFAVVNAINGTAKVAQRAVQLRVKDEFTLRENPLFIQRQAAIIKPFASVKQGRAFAEISVGQRRRLLLPAFEAGGVREPFTPGAKSVAVPVGARPSKQQPVPEALFFQRLKFRRTARRSNVGRAVWRGTLGTYLISGEGVFQRIARAASRVLYVFARNVRIPKKLGFVDTIAGTARRVFPEAMKSEIRKALERRR